MASDEMEKYRKIDGADMKYIFPGDALFFEGDEGLFEVEVVSACSDDCMVLVNGKKVTVSWDQLRVLA